MLLSINVQGNFSGEFSVRSLGAVEVEAAKMMMPMAIEGVDDEIGRSGLDRCAMK